jgi:Icc-related predicted phosphoesterase
MKCVAVSDFHMHDVVTPRADLLIVAGDMTYRGTKAELDWFTAWMKKQPQRHKVWIAGNHELGFEDDPELAEQIAKATNSTYLDDSSTVVEGVTIYGSPITPWFYDWAFNRHRGEAIRQHWEKIPEGLDILITHGPPFGKLDFTSSKEHAGCEDLLEVLSETLQKPPRFHIFGHIHSGYGRDAINRKDGQTIQLMNVSACDDQYQSAHPPILFEI